MGASRTPPGPHFTPVHLISLRQRAPVGVMGAACCLLILCLPASATSFLSLHCMFYMSDINANVFFQ